LSAPRAVLLDFNGTLSRDEPLLLRIYQGLFARYGKPLTEAQYYEQLAGRSEEAIIGGWLGVDGPLLGSLVAERVDAYAAEAADGTTVTQEMREAVRHAAERVPVAIVSGAFRAEIEPVLAAAGLMELITAIVAADDVEHGKPHPEGYLRALDLLGLDGADAVAFEDTEAGIAAAVEAGVRCIGVRGTLPDDRLAAAGELVDRIDVALLRRLLEGDRKA
jgi:beta-phosphoglucomutase-like phosphatase (HAD superfamily)